MVGFYISGHPLDDYKLEMENFCNFNISELKDLQVLKGKIFILLEWYQT